jgi:F-type H+-transporting ATPase subunit delta
MKGTKSAIRYAQSLLSLSIEKGVLEEAKADMTLVSTVCEQNHDLELMLQSPIIKTEKKQSVLKSVFENSVSALTLDFIALITSKGRERLIPNIAASFIELYKTNKGIVTVYVTSAVALTETQKTDVAKDLNLTGTVELVEIVDPSILGGMIIKIGDMRFDASISRKIHDLKFDISKH